MARLNVSCCVLLAALAIAGAGLGLAANDDDPPAATPETRIRAALNQKVSCDFDETELTDVANYFEQVTKIEIVLDTKALEEIGVDGSQPVTMKLSKISLAAALRHIFRSIDPTITFTVQNDVLLITTGDVADETQQTVIYDVADFAEQNAEPEIRHVGAGNIGNHSDRFSDHFDALIEVITSAVQPDSWDEVGGPGSIAMHANTLLVKQNWQIHEQVKYLLACLRTVRDLAATQHEPVCVANPHHEAARQVIEKALAAPTPALDFQEAPLSDVVTHLRQATKIPMLLDNYALDEIGIDGDTSVTIRVKGISLGAALRLLLRSIDPTLTHQVMDEALVFTSDEVTEGNLQVLLYPVADLVGGRETTEGSGGDLDFDALIEAITKTIQPDSWDEVGGPGSITEYAPCRCLIIAQTESVHQEIKQLLAQMRSVAAKRKIMPAADQPASEADPHALRIAVYHLRRPPPVRHAEVEGKIPRPARSDGTAPAEEAEKIATLVRQLVEPASWEEGEASIHAIDGKLVIRQQDSVHRKVENLLSSLDLLESAGLGGGSHSGS